MKSITIMGMSGVGKTTLADKLNKSSWFHYSADYRIASHYLKNDINKFIQQEAHKSAVLGNLLSTNSIEIKSKLSINNLLPVSAYIGKLGKVSSYGLDFDTFIKRQDKHYKAEIKATFDIGEFKEKARKKNYKYFLHDSGGSLCELSKDKKVISYLAKQTNIIYIHANKSLAKEITERALQYPKPLYYDKQFLLSQLKKYKEETGEELENTEPNDLIKYIIPNLMQHRELLYLDIANKYGVVIDASDILKLRDGKDLLEIINSNKT